MIQVPVHWLTYSAANPERGRWDQLFIERLLSGEEGRPSYGYQYHDIRPDQIETSTGRVIVFSAGHYAENGIADMAVDKLNEYLATLDWSIVIATSDECQTFPWERIRFPRSSRLWVMLPRVDRDYPDGTRFIGEGSPVSGADICEYRALTRDLDLVLIGQGGHDRRDQAFAAASAITDRRSKVTRTPGFTQGMEQELYLHAMTRGWIAPAPSGICSQSSFRAYEALEAGCIPILDNVSPQGNEGFWEMLGLDKVAPTIDYWRDLPSMVDSLLVNRHENAAHCSARWQQHKRQMLRWLRHDTDEEFLSADLPWDDITVIIPTSPVPSNPDLSMIQQTIESVRVNLPGSEILITCDGVRDEQLDRKSDYDVFLHELCVWTNTQYNVWPFLHHTHQHQSGMMHHILREVDTPFVLYVEHDAPLEGHIPFDEIVRTMNWDNLNSMRFLHEVAIPPGSEHLFLDHETILPSDASRVPYARTIQWSQRPHLARTEWYRQVMAENFAPDARTMIEDVMHGVAQANTYAGRIRAHKAWERWRMAVYAPEGSWKRSGHYNGRGDDPKFSMLMKYPDGVRPEGAPPEGWQ